MSLSFLQFIFFVICVYETSITFVCPFPNNVTDHKALLSLKASITNDPLGILSSWNDSIHFCQWTGVTCSRRRQRVTALNLSNQHLVGTFSPHIGNMSFLRRISIYENNFHGSIPNEISRLFRLQQLSLTNNSFQGGFPTNLSHCIDIRQIDMNNNNLEGNLPTEFASWSKLVMLSLRNNHFTRSIPTSIGNASSLRILDLNINDLVGGIPLELAHQTKLQILDLGMNNMSGTVPSPLYNMSSLVTVDLSYNMLKGTLPSDFGFTLPKLQNFYVECNNFSGPIPPSIANASNLVKLEISENNITGPIPNNLGSLPNLQWLSLAQNPLGDSMPPDEWSFFNSVVNCTHLHYLGLNENGLTGELPRSIVNISTTMVFLYRNHIYGSIPREIGKLKNTKVLSLSLFDNLLTGTIPESIGELSNLNGLDLGYNNISGIIPTSISNMTQLVVLRLSDNMLQGSLPTKLFAISTLQKLDITNNRLTGVIPVDILFSSQCVFLFLGQNLLNGTLPSNIGNMKQLIVLDVSENRLTGDIPTSLGGCVMLEQLYMDGNRFQGEIPSSFKALKSLAFLHLSNNNISGSIPSFFDSFRLIISLDLSHNKLGGEVSKEGVFSNVSAFSVVGNLELCGGIQALHLPACPHEKVSRNKRKTFALRIVLLLVLVPLGLLLACLALICYRRRNSKKLNDPVPVSNNNRYLKLSYQDLLLATNEFSPINLLGEGRYASVYKGVLESVEHIVAVKVLHVEVHGANKSFLEECETLRNIRHRNLIKIITACSSTDFKGNDFKALVFEFMTNGSLDNWLHPSPSYQENVRNLTLIQRLNISIDVALGLDYLHHHSHASIIHSDIKPSNILLDEDFVAHIGDFGLARFSFATKSDVNQAQMSSTGVRGTIGYVPPEYGMFGEISTEGDVYSYGILVLELFSGKRATESSNLMDSSNNLHDYVREALPQRVMDIADPRIVLEQEERGLIVNQSSSRATMEECLSLIFQVGILCSQESPRKRIDISVAIKELHVARDKYLQHRLPG